MFLSFGFLPVAQNVATPDLSVAGNEEGTADIAVPTQQAAGGAGVACSSRDGANTVAATATDELSAITMPDRIGEQSALANQFVAKAEPSDVVRMDADAKASNPSGANATTSSAAAILPTAIEKITVSTQPAEATLGTLPFAVSAEIAPRLASLGEVPNVLTPFSGAESSGSQRELNSASEATSGEELNGTTAAMHQVIMKEQSPERQTRTQSSVAAVASAAGKLRAAEVPEKNSEVQTSTSGTSAQTLTAMAFEPQTGGGHAANAPASDVPVAAEINRQTFEIIERVHATGHDRAEVRMHLNDGQEVTVSLRLERGEWKPTFKTESEALCRALEQNWQRAVPQPSSQSVKFGTPVFQSEGSQSGLEGNSQQQSESGARERSFNRREQESIFENPVPSRANPRPAPSASASASRFSEAAAVQLYA